MRTRCRAMAAVTLAAVVAAVLVRCDGYAADTVKGCGADKTCDKTAGVVRYDVPGSDNGSALKEIVVIDTTSQSVTADTTTNTTGVTPKTTGITPKTTGGTPKTTGSTPKTTGVSPKTTGVSPKTTAVTASTTVGATTNNISGPTKTTAATVASTTTVATSTTTVSTSTTTETIDVTSANNGATGILRFITYKYCYCDLIYGGCDINCCCDADCTSHDLTAFTVCADQVQSSLIKPVSILFDSSLFYVVIDNVPSDYFYPERATIQSESQITTSLRNRDVFTWHDNEMKKNRPPPDPVIPPAELVYNNYDLTYKSQRWMYTIVVSDVNTTEIKTFGLKNSAFNSLCAVEQPVEYLLPKETHCQTFVANLTDICHGDSSLSFERYYGQRGLFKVVQPIYVGVHKTKKIDLTTVQATAHHHCVTVDGSPYDCRAVRNSADPYRHPVYSAGVCRRTVRAVEYVVTHNGTNGVRELNVHFYHRDVPDTGRPVFLDQTFGVRFVRANGTATVDDPQYERSGKPGYSAGNPVLVTAASGVDHDSNRNHRPKPFDLPDPSARGTCDSNPAEPSRRQPVNFLENVSIQCRVPVRGRRWSNGTQESAANQLRLAELCQDIQNQTISALGDYERTLVASLGDPEVASWIPVVIVKTQSPPAPSPSDDSTCPSIINGMHVRVLYSHVGTFDRPQATVLGVLVNYTASTTVAVNMKRAGAPADDVPIRATVVFVDLTRPPIRTFAEPPTYEFRLPEDFYYPFWSSDNAKSMAANNGAGNSGTCRGPAFGDLRSSPIGFSILLLFNLLYLSRALL